jgi:hypothetical protein
MQYSVAHRTAAMADIITAVGATGYINIYTGAAPANCGTVASGTLLVSLPCSATYGVASAGVLTANAITATAATGTGTAGYYRLCTSAAGTTVIEQGTVGTSGADLNLNSVSITATQTVSVTSKTNTAFGA